MRTGSAGRAAVRLASGVELRLDNTTRVALNDVRHARLRRGGVYVDSGASGADASRDLELDTAAGTVRHLGTQYQARVTNGVLTVGVREGLVAIETGGHETVGRAGQVVTLQGGQATTAELAANAEAWNWASSIAPPFAIEGRTGARIPHLGRSRDRPAGRLRVAGGGRAGAGHRAARLDGRIDARRGGIRRALDDGAASGGR